MTRSSTGPKRTRATERRSISGDVVQNVVAESELTKRAREVLAGLDGKLVAALTGRWVWQIEGVSRIPTDSLRGLKRRGLTRSDASKVHYVTDLGREVARLISAANAEVGNA